MGLKLQKVKNLSHKQHSKYLRCHETVQLWVKSKKVYDILMRRYDRIITPEVLLNVVAMRRIMGMSL